MVTVAPAQEREIFDEEIFDEYFEDLYADEEFGFGVDPEDPLDLFPEAPWEEDEDEELDPISFGLNIGEQLAEPWVGQASGELMGMLEESPLWAEIQGYADDPGAQAGAVIVVTVWLFSDSFGNFVSDVESAIDDGLGFDIDSIPIPLPSSISELHAEWYGFDVEFEGGLELDLDDDNDVGGATFEFHFEVIW